MKITFDATKTQRAIKVIDNQLENLESAAKVYGSQVKEVHGKSGLIWLKTLGEQVDAIAEATKKQREVCDDIRTGLARYANQVSEYSRDTRGM